MAKTTRQNAVTVLLEVDVSATLSLLLFNLTSYPYLTVICVATEIAFEVYRQRFCSRTVKIKLEFVSIKNTISYKFQSTI